MNGEFINLDTAKKIQEDKNLKEKLLKIINNYGEKKQLKKLIEEVYEFIESILTDDGSVESLVHIEEEFSDVCVILEQFKAQYGLNNKNIIETINYKVDRQLGRIENDNNKN